MPDKIVQKKQILTKITFVFDFFLKNNICSLFDNSILNTFNQTIISAETNSAPVIDPLVYLVKDIPSYLQLRLNPAYHHLKRKRVIQYEGYAIDLNAVNSVEDYLIRQLSKRNKKNLLAKKRKLESTCQISYKVFLGNTLLKEDFDQLFTTFYSLLKQRFKQKRVFNRYLDRWDELQAMVFPLLQKRKASLFVILDKGRPINITLNFHVGEIVYSHIQTYDLRYAKFNLGDISILKQLEWCFDNQIKLYDLLMGKTYYKTKWCNTIYKYSYDIFYKKNNVLANVLAYALGQFLALKQFLRNQNIIGQLFSYDRFIYERRFGKNKLHS